MENKTNKAIRKIYTIRNKFHSSLSLDGRELKHDIIKELDKILDILEKNDFDDKTLGPKMTSTTRL